ncbi:uncharacterized protein LOC108735106 [Agrilus planipennis]|uniref:Uncharacterized protein LOC108735106 n=1 Tax=Agrilus planipennis TaxID=224129 RepID=A0A1W4WQY1_AGRPL|nr:uncharacterized protein LOC108735106 [Agrilus planipennis]
MFLVFLFVSVIGAIKSDSDASAVRNLVGEPDYHRVKLQWESDAKHTSKSAFQIRYCELQVWGTQRCRSKSIEPKNENKPTRMSDEEDNTQMYSADIEGLRMATTYSFEIKTKQKNLATREERANNGDKSQNMIVIPTKGFSARATQCLPHASVIEVSTGPYFGGRIAVEAADGERCALDGEPNSPRDVYTLRINHTECGSKVNETTVATYVIVQENLPILTHSTRRFLVLCTYQPETLTVRAGINLPSSQKGRGKSDALAVEDDGNMRRGRFLRPPKLQTPAALVNEEEEPPEEVSSTNNHKSIPLALLAILMTAGVVGLVAVAVKWSSKKARHDADNISIASEISTTSCSTIAEEEYNKDDKTSSKYQGLETA